MKIQRICIAFEDDTVGIMSFVLNDGYGVVQPNTDEAIEKEVQRSLKPVRSWRRIKAKDIPTHREYRGAWVEDLTVDIAKAKEIHKDILRKEREPLLAQLDVEYMQALESQDEQWIQSVAARKQSLRDITVHSSLDKVQSVRQLKTLTIDKLHG